MPSIQLRTTKLTEGDLDFLVEAASPEVTDKMRLRQILREDEDFRTEFVRDEKVFRKVIEDDKILLKISPGLFFEILLRRAANALRNTSYTLEKTSTMRIPVFDSQEVVELLENKALLSYLAHMLSSFIKTEGYAVSFRAKRGIWIRMRFSDLDIHSLMRYCDVVEEKLKLSVYKRIADICLFILGIFPDYAERDYRYPFSGQMRPQIRGKVRISPKQYEEEGRRFYKLAAEHQSAEHLALSDVFRTLHRKFREAKKPLNFIAEYYL